MPTIKDIAKASGVSYPTVSHVINKTRPVSPSTERRVREAMARLKYRPSAVARGLLKKRMNTLGVVLPFAPHSVLSHHHLGPVVDGILDFAQHHGQSAMFFTARHRPESPENIDLYSDGRCDGLLVIGQPSDSPFVRTLAEGDLPFVCINEQWEDTGIMAVDIAQVEAAQGLAEYLLALGHRRIAVLRGDDDQVSVKQRTQGFRAALEARQVPMDETLILAGWYSEESGRKRAAQVWAMPQAIRPTALFCQNDQIALGALAMLGELGVRVPEEMSVVGFDDMAGTANSNPPLTTLRLPMRELGRRATELLIAQVEGDKTAKPRQLHLLPTEVIRRGSVGSSRAAVQV